MEYCFHHIPKTAGQSVRKALGEWDWGAAHLTAFELFQANPILWEEYKTEVSFDYDKFEKGNKTAGTRVRKTAQELKDLMQVLRKEVLETRKN